MYRLFCKPLSCSYILHLTQSLQVYAEQPLFRRIAYTCARGVKKIIEQGHWGMIGNSKPEQMREDLWELLGRIWAIDPAGRPAMMEVVEKMKGFRSD